MLAATRGYLDAGWDRVKALLGRSVFEAALQFFGSGRTPGELAVAAAADDTALVDALLRSGRDALWLLIAVRAANVVLAVWRPSLTVKVRREAGPSRRGRRAGTGRTAAIDSSETSAVLISLPGS